MDNHERDTATRDAALWGLAAGAVCLFVLWFWQRADDMNLSRAEARGDTGRIWPVDHPVLSALIVFAVVAIGYRLYVLMRRIEDRS